jgi:large conductance mechanosensitive channel
MGMIKEFKEFAMKGNVVDMAIGVVIGAAFGNIVTSLVKDVFTPFIGIIAQTDGLGEKAYTVVNPVTNATATLAYGKFIEAGVQFLLVALCLFLVVKIMNSMKRKEAVAPEVPLAPTKDQQLLMEIRDLLKQK